MTTTSDSVYQPTGLENNGTPPYEHLYECLSEELKRLVWERQLQEILSDKTGGK